MQLQFDRYIEHLNAEIADWQLKYNSEKLKVNETSLENFKVMLHVFYLKIFKKNFLTLILIEQLKAEIRELQLKNFVFCNEKEALKHFETFLYKSDNEHFFMHQYYINLFLFRHSKNDKYKKKIRKLKGELTKKCNTYELLEKENDVLLEKLHRKKPW